MGLVNRVVPLEELEEETVAWCREMLELSPFSLRLLKASFNAAEDGLAGIQQLAHDANLLFYGSRGGAGGPERLPREAPAGLREVPEAALTHLRLWLLAARPRTLPAAIAPVLVGTALAGSEGTFRVGAVHRGAGGQRVHPDRDEPVERLLGRPPRRRHRGPARPGARDRGRADAAAARAGGHLRGLRRGGGGGPLPRGGGRLGAAGGGRRLDPGRRALHGRPAPVRLRGPRRAVRVHVLRARGRGGLVLRAGRGPALGGGRARRAGGAARRRDPGGEQRARHRYRPARREAHAGCETGPRPGARRCSWRWSWSRSCPDRADLRRCRRGCSWSSPRSRWCRRSCGR